MQISLLRVEKKEKAENFQERGEEEPNRQMKEILGLFAWAEIGTWNWNWNCKMVIYIYPESHKLFSSSQTFAGSTNFNHFLYFPSVTPSRARLVGRKVDDGNGNECKGVKIKSRGKLGNDEKLKFVALRKNVR